MLTTNNSNKIFSVALGDYTPVAASEKEDRQGWVRYGDDNKFPLYLLEMAESSPVHGALCTSISQMVAGDGLDGITPEIHKALRIDKLLDKSARDLKIMGVYYWEIIYSLDGTEIKKINHLPAENCRLAKSDEDDEITGVYYSQDWNNLRKYPPVFVPKFSKGNTEDRRQCYFAFLSEPGSGYYGKPDYWPAINAIEESRQIGIFHVNNIINGLFPSFMVNFLNGIPDEETKAGVIAEFEKQATGARNAGKIFFTFGDKDGAPQITTFPISDADKQYQQREDSVTRNIMIGHRVTSPLLFGIRDTGGGLGSNSDEMRQAFVIFNSQVIRPMQQTIVEGFEEVLGQAGMSIKPYMIKGVFEEEQETEDVASSALNGAQIASLVQVVTQVAIGTIPKESARAIIESSFPTLTAEQINAIFESILEGSIDPAEVVLKAVEKKKTCCLSADGPSDDDAKKWIARLEVLGEVIDAEEWELVHEDTAGNRDDEKELNEKYNALTSAMLSLDDYANGDEKSKWGDAGLYKLRYQYAGEISGNSREFCIDMIGLSNQGKVFRYEDIADMSDAGINGSFAPQGQSTYDIFTWKGGVYCHHYWKRLIYLRKRDKNGRILPNDGLRNEKRVGNVPYVPQKGPEGTKPIDTPTRGSLKNA
jgi:hypothetical protein